MKAPWVGQLQKAHEKDLSEIDDDLYLTKLSCSFLTTCLVSMPSNEGTSAAHAVQVDGAFEEAPRCSEITVRAQQQVRRVAGAVHRPVQLLSPAVDLDVGLVYATARADRALVPTQDRSKN